MNQSKQESEELFSLQGHYVWQVIDSMKKYKQLMNPTRELSGYL